MGELEKYLKSREPKLSLWGNDLSLKERWYYMKMEFEEEWDHFRMEEETLHGIKIKGTESDKLIYYLVKKGIL